MNRAGSSRLIAGLTCLATAACARTSPATRTGGDLAAPGAAGSTSTEGAATAALPVALADGGAAGYRLRVLLARHHRARVAPERAAPWSEADEAGLNAFAPAVNGPYPYVVIEPGTWPRVLSEYGGVRLLLYVDPADAQPVAVRPARLRQKADEPAAGELGVTIYPGLPIAAMERAGALTKVHLQDQALRAEGWVDASDVGILFEPKVAPPRDDLQVLLKAPTPLLAGPGGARLGETTPEALLACRILAPDQKGFTKVLIRSIDTASNGVGTLNYEARAFVPTSALGPPGGAGIGPAGGLPITGYSETFTLPPATRLYDHPGGSVVGVTVGRASAWHIGPRKNDWQGLWVPTPWGALTLWMAPPGR